MTQEELDKLNEMTDEPNVTFKYLSDKRTLAIETEDEDYRILEISGYDLNIAFNRDLLKSVEDIEDMLDGLKELFRKLVLQDLLENQEIEPNKDSE